MKWLELLKQISPGVMRAAVLPQPSGIGQFGAIQGAASTFGAEVIPLGVRDIAEIERAVTTFARSLNDGLASGLREFWLPWHQDGRGRPWFPKCQAFPLLPIIHAQFTETGA